MPARCCKNHKVSSVSKQLHICFPLLLSPPASCLPYSNLVLRNELCRDFVRVLVRAAERKQTGLSDPYEKHSARKIAEHIADYREFLLSKQNTEKHVDQTIRRITKLCEGCGFRRIAELDCPTIVAWLAEQRRTRKRFSAQTSNFYQDAVKAFGGWLCRYERMPNNTLSSLERISVETDRRHDRRSLNDEEFRRLVNAAANGRVIESVSGADRAMLYILAAWTGFRRRELASLSEKSLDLSSEQPTITVEAAFSKHRKKDVVPLHSEVACRIRDWLSTKSRKPDEPLFSLVTPKGYFRKTAKMMREDLATARETWLEEAEDDEQREEREATSFLSYTNEDGLFADFHANRHSFISNLGRAGVSLTTAQKLARHSDPRLTANRYTHLDVADQKEAVETLPAPPTIKASNGLVTPGVTPTPDSESQSMSPTDKERHGKRERQDCPKSRNSKTLGNQSHQESSSDKSTPQRIRTSNLRFRRPMLYPVELGVLGGGSGILAGFGVFARVCGRFILSVDVLFSSSLRFTSFLAIFLIVFLRVLAGGT